MAQERTEVNAECDRLQAVALPELERIDWFHAIGQPSDIPNEWGIWERDIDRGVAGFDAHFREKVLHVNVDLNKFIDGWFPMPFGWTFAWNPTDDVIAYYDQFSEHICARISEAGSQFPWWTESTERSVIFDAKYYAVTRAFEATEGLQEYQRLPDYYIQAFRLYQAGRFPCGWTRKFNLLSKRWKKGRFIYI